MQGVTSSLPKIPAALWTLLEVSWEPQWRAFRQIWRDVLLLAMTLRCPIFWLVHDGLHDIPWYVLIILFKSSNDRYFSITRSRTRFISSFRSTASEVGSNQDGWCQESSTETSELYLGWIRFTLLMTSVWYASLYYGVRTCTTRLFFFS